MSVKFLPKIVDKNNPRFVTINNDFNQSVSQSLDLFDGKVVHQWG